MNLEIILTSSLISIIVGGIVKLLADKHIKKIELELAKQNKDFELKLNSLIEKRKVDYDLLTKSLQSIWEQLSIMENHFILTMSKNYDQDPQWKVIREAGHNIRTQMLFVPDSIHDDIDKFLNKIFENYIQSYSDDCQKLIAHHKVTSQQITKEQHPELFEGINAALKSLQGEFWKGKDDLRKKIRDNSQKIYSGPIE
jgi:hypothetical protein